MDNPLLLWFHSCGKIVKDSNLQKTTHFMLDGGKIDLSSDYLTFQEMYAKYIKCKNCIVERKTNVFLFFIDFDVLCEEIIDVNPFIKSIQETMKFIYQKEYVCIITGADKNKIIKRDNIDYIKQGYHLHWPDIYVDKHLALKIRKNIVINLTTMYGKDSKFYDSWEKIIDKTVYEQNGLRLIGSDKCSISDGIKTYENRVYEIKFVYNGLVYSQELTNFYKEKSNILKAIKDTSIRTNKDKLTEYKNLNEYEETEEEYTDKGGFERIKKNSTECIAIEKFLKNYVIGYRLEDIRHILKVKDKELYIIDSKSKYCQNIKDFHSNNHIFFKLSPFGFCQKCRSERHGEHGCCREYNSEYISITTSLESALGWKRPKSKDISESKDFNISNLLEKLENNITGKPKFMGPVRKK
jgi:hypothetical protein